jgi:hypothetical protein
MFRFGCGINWWDLRKGMDCLTECECDQWDSEVAVGGGVWGWLPLLDFLL